MDIRTDLERQMAGMSLSKDRNLADPFDLHMGESSEKGLEFCPWKLIRVYPHNYVNEPNKEQVAGFFRETLFKDRTWDFFCLLDPGKNGRDPLLLVPTSQFVKYIANVNIQLNARLAVPKHKEANRFFATFGEFDTPLPRFLGRADSFDTVEALKLQTGRITRCDLDRLSTATLQIYQKKMDELYDSCKSKKSKRDTEAARLKRIERFKGYGRMAKRVQRYLGLREETNYMYQSSSKSSASNWNVSMPVPFEVNNPVRFVCVDIEAWEKERHVVTEIGFAVLDTKDIMRVAPGNDGHNWFPLVKSYHLRIWEHAEKVNRLYVRGCPDRFDFGESEFVNLKNIGKEIDAIIGDYESGDATPVIMVGHDIRQDLKYLQQVGYNIWRVRHFSDEVDTKSMFQRLTRSPNGRGLAMVCEELGIPGRNFHNAGNDATYTLRAMIVMAVKQMFEDSEGLKENETNRAEWSDGEMDDGGMPQKSTESG
ncbi:hypothetical protein GGR54DRAFT_170867 [Hypoxylon sp. NC1633]|nr:hypothetical protein GGR54DRAFT_170867 [Hypoxylon sp. NC1633]